MRKVRCLYFLMSLFSLISLICIGFSSWTISGTGAEVMGTGGITASPVYDVDEYATCTSVECFEYHSSGFLQNSIDSKYGYVTASYTLSKTDEMKSKGIKLSVYLRANYASGFSSASVDFNLNASNILQFMGYNVKAKKQDGTFVNLKTIHYYEQYDYSVGADMASMPDELKNISVKEDIASSTSFLNEGYTFMIVIPDAALDYTEIAVEYIFTSTGNVVFEQGLKNGESKAEFFAHARIS